MMNKEFVKTLKSARRKTVRKPLDLKLGDRIMLRASDYQHNFDRLPFVLSVREWFLCWELKNNRDLASVLCHGTLVSIG